MNIIMQETKISNFSQVDKNSLSLAELKQLKADWLKCAIDNGYVENVELIVETLGTETAVDARPGWTCYTYRRGSLIAKLYQGTGKYITARKSFDHISILNVFVNENQVVFIRDSEESLKEDYYFVPGAWLDQILADLDKAEKIYQARIDTIEENERQALIKQMLIGIPV